ncbi:hypothetical protein GFC29_3222 [Anoxybacillus sp. B7M1]|jgi:hypothetical protein|uniref:DUF6843 domain-containing protein n=1 Tax=Anoxybacillaceae TaxID=3120669 RepID=UPI0005CD4A88|nr:MULTISPECIES: hypothetical protein [Anoxybacillus]ANB58128.1 hypothetical protein GFC28_2214 [Anoxybacillus sp. B2M1]ANB65023.1 hypothetical protein GFC29_3222 [Anoxybacillus sp. B7M1]MBB3907765.1 hypothetical protein [Anoxybacillus rupiensis]
MKKLLISIVVIVIFIGGGYWLHSRQPYDEEYLIPKNFKGCIYIVYNIQGAPPLTVREHTIFYTFDQNGVLITSSPEDFGWEGKLQSGFFKTHYFYIDENGKKIAKIPQEMIGQVVLGDYTNEHAVTITRKTFSIGDPHATCDTNYNELLKKLEKNYNINF